MEIDGWLHKLLVAYEPKRPWMANDGQSLRCLEMHRLLHLPRYARDPFGHLFEMHEIYDIALSDLAELHRQVQRMEMTLASGLPPHLFRALARKRAQTMIIEGLLLAISIFFNSMLQAFACSAPAEADLELIRTKLVRDALTLSQSMVHLRPLWSDGFTMTLGITWVAARDPRVQREVEDAIALYVRPHLVSTLIIRAGWMRERLEILREGFLKSRCDYEQAIVASDALGLPDGKPVVGECVIL